MHMTSIKSQYYFNDTKQIDSDSVAMLSRMQTLIMGWSDIDG